MFIGTSACAPNWTLLTCVGTTNTRQAFGSAGVAEHSPAGSGASTCPLSRASAKYHWVAALLFVIITGTVTALPAFSLTECDPGRPCALTCAELKATFAENGSEVRLPDVE